MISAFYTIPKMKRDTLFCCNLLCLHSMLAKVDPPTEAAAFAFQIEIECKDFSHKQINLSTAGTFKHELNSFQMKEEKRKKNKQMLYWIRRKSNFTF